MVKAFDDDGVFREDSVSFVSDNSEELGSDGCVLCVGLSGLSILSLSL